ncbi:MAG: flagellin [Verrucomicrobia bacterium]|nr:flagellin [Verrucomicrobiota bacterium]
MSVVINSNFAASVAANNLAASSDSLQKSLNRLSSGSKIVTPSDDAGGLAVAMKLSAAARRSGAALNNIGNTTSFLQTQEGVMKVTSKILDRMGELATLYTDPTKGASDKANYSTEFDALSAELTKLGSETFNNIGLFGSVSVNTTEAGSGAIATTSYTMASGLTIGSLSGINSAIDSLATARAANGAAQSRLGFAAEVLTVNRQNLEAAHSRIMDVDVAAESTQLARWNILVQSGTAMLSQANQSAQSALKLLQ